MKETKQNGIPFVIFTFQTKCKTQALGHWSLNTGHRKPPKYILCSFKQRETKETICYNESQMLVTSTFRQPPDMWSSLSILGFLNTPCANHVQKRYSVSQTVGLSWADGTIVIFTSMNSMIYDFGFGSVRFDSDVRLMVLVLPRCPESRAGAAAVCMWGTCAQHIICECGSSFSAPYAIPFHSVWFVSEEPTVYLRRQQKNERKNGWNF